MRQLTEVELRRLRLLNENSVSVSLLEPTRTGLGKYYMDATRPVRIYLKEKQCHDYELQNQGQENKVFVNAVIISQSSSINTKVSLYRPDTKQGDPRIQISKLNKHCNPNDIIALIYYDQKLWVINLTQLPIETLLFSKISNPLREFITEVFSTNNEVSAELLQKLKAIGRKGYIKSLVNADTGVGRTLESLLGIPMNSTKGPDYKGIELKSYRSWKRNRKQLFAKTPNWSLSKFKSHIDILNAFGYWSEGVFRKYTTERATGRNAQGLMLRVEYDQGWLLENSDRPDIGDFLVWELELLRKTLALKHKETFWIHSESVFDDGNEFFWYKAVKHTHNPLIDQFGPLIELGAIEVDYCIRQRPDGTYRDHGCNFKIKPDSFNLLFPPPSEYSLIS